MNYTVSAQPQLFDVFLSHAHVDGELVEELGGGLKIRLIFRFGSIAGFLFQVNIGNRRWQKDWNRQIDICSVYRRRYAAGMVS